MKLVFATHNAGKLREVKELIGHKYEVIGLSELDDFEEIPENEPTLEGNALIKACGMGQIRTGVFFRRHRLGD